MREHAKLLWVDLEMTGLDPIQDRILEVGAIATDWEFREIASFTAVCKVDPELLEERMVGPFWEKFSDVCNQLKLQNDTGKITNDVEVDLLRFVDQHFDKSKPILLAGNSIHQDRKFIDHEWPTLAGKLHYRMLDVSAWKLVFEGKLNKKFTKPEAHRALEDIQGSIEELKYYIKKMA